MYPPHLQLLTLLDPRYHLLRFARATGQATWGFAGKASWHSMAESEFTGTMHFQAGITKHVCRIGRFWVWILLQIGKPWPVASAQVRLPLQLSCMLPHRHWDQRCSPHQNCKAMKAIAKRRNQEKPGKSKLSILSMNFHTWQKAVDQGIVPNLAVRLPLISGRLQENLAAAQPADGVEMAKRVLQLLDDEGR